MYNKTAKYYDEIYSFKDYKDEAAKIEGLISREHPEARTILDVACGTAEHAKLLSERFEVSGIDLQPEFIEIARRKIPSGDFHLADMRSFDLRRTFDVVQCLFSSIGYLTSGEEVIDALRCFKAHLNPAGVILIEPWFTPETWIDGLPWTAHVDKPDLKICRMNVSAREGKISIVHFHYLIGTPEGVEHFEERHELALYTLEEMKGFFEAAGLEVKHDPEGIFGRGMYVARRAAAVL